MIADSSTVSFIHLILAQCLYTAPHYSYSIYQNLSRECCFVLCWPEH